MIRVTPPWHGLNHATHHRYRPEMSYEQWFAYQRSYVDTAYAGPHLRIMQVPQRYDTTVSATEDTAPPGRSAGVYQAVSEMRVV
jgi:hypothetical protein